MYDVVGVGNALVDIIADAETADLERLALRKGVMSLVDEAEADRLLGEMAGAGRSSGGSAANTLAGLASLGGSAAFIGKVADDELGAVFRRDLEAVGVSYGTEPAADGPPTARCLIFVTPDADRTMQTCLGVSVLLGPEDIDPATVRAAGVTYLEGYLFDLDSAKRAFVHAAEIAHAAGRRVALTLSDPFCVDRHRGAFRQLVEGHVDILFANRDELLSLYETADLDGAVAAAAAHVDIAAVTMSGDGSVLAAGGELVEVAAEPVASVVDTTGAGDLYAAGVLFGVTRGYELGAAGRIGAVCAAEVISHHGARPETPLAGLVRAALG